MYPDLPDDGAAARRARARRARRPPCTARAASAASPCWGRSAATKGGLFLQALATDAQDRDLPLRFSIVGFSDPALAGGLERVGVTQTGRYHGDHEALDLVWRLSADLVLLPAIWPETYSYALTLALRTGLPVAAFDLGAPGERLRAYPNGHLLPYALATDPAAFNDRLLAIDVSAERPALRADPGRRIRQPAARLLRSHGLTAASSPGAPCQRTLAHFLVEAGAKRRGQRRCPPSRRLRRRRARSSPICTCCTL